MLCEDTDSGANPLVLPLALPAGHAQQGLQQGMPCWCLVSDVRSQSSGRGGTYDLPRVRLPPSLPTGYHGCASLSVPSFAPALVVGSTPRLILLYSTPSIALTSPGLLGCLLYFVFSSSSPPLLFLLAVAARCSAPLALTVACCYRAEFLILFSIPLSPLPPLPSFPAPWTPRICWALIERIFASPPDQLSPARQAPSLSAGPCSASPAPDSCIWRS